MAKALGLKAIAWQVWLARARTLAPTGADLESVHRAGVWDLVVAIDPVPCPETLVLDLSRINNFRLQYSYLCHVCCILQGLQDFLEATANPHPVFFFCYIFKA